MRPRSTQSLQYQRVYVPRETPTERQAREARSLQVARQMFSNGCTANDIARYTGLKEDALRLL